LQAGESGQCYPVNGAERQRDECGNANNQPESAGYYAMLHVISLYTNSIGGVASGIRQDSEKYDKDVTRFKAKEHELFDIGQ
jgi:hypothetical protein